MKKAFLILTVLIFSSTMAQKFNYDKEWKEIEKQEKKGEFKSLLPQIDKIYNQASKEKNYPQIIKSLFFQSKILMVTSDDDDFEIEVVTNFIDEINRADYPEKAVLQSYLAELYVKYYSTNGYKVRNRTDIAGGSGEDFRFWSETDFYNESSELFWTSIQDAAVLQKKSSADWMEILREANDSEFGTLRPTLYDILAHRVIEFYKEKESKFWYRNFDKEENQVAEERIATLYRSLIDFHLQRGDYAAAAYNELELLKFNSNKLPSGGYEKSLLELSNKYPDNKFSPLILWELSLYYKGLIGSVEANDYAERKRLTEESMFYLDEIIRKFPKSEVAGFASDAKEGFLFPNFDVDVEGYFYPNQINPMRVSHQNLNNLYFKVYELKEGDRIHIKDLGTFTKDNLNQEVLDKAMKALSMTDEFSVNLRAFDDYQSHTTLVKMNPLNSGNYLVLVSNNPDFKIKKGSLVRFKVVSVSKYVLTLRGNEVLLTDRETGIPVVNKEIKIRTYTSYNWKNQESLITDEFGKAVLKGYDNTYSVRVEYSVDNREFVHDSYYYPPKSAEPEKPKTYVKFFTDRGIYRPGQAVYFKGIIYEEDANKNRQAIPNKTVEVELTDPNGKKVSSLLLKSNEYGSVSGEFILPSGGLTGNYYLKERISSYRSSYSFSVEEYKRPKFEVKFDRVEDIFKLEEEVSAKGTAEAYSGANIDNAKVVYRVYRTAIYPYRPWWWGGSSGAYEPSEEIAQGETLTDADGKFEIKFEARPAKEKKDGEPRTYTYRIVADVTDINGETHSSEQSITVGDLRYKLAFSVADKIEISNWDSLEMSTQNLNGMFSPAKGKVTLTKINPSDRVLRNSLLGGTDYELYPKNEFINYFPHEPYGVENNKQNWKKGKTVIDTDFDTEKSESIKVNTKNWEEGYYVLSGYIKDGNDSIKSEKLVYLYRNEKLKPVDYELFAISKDKDKYQPGDTAKIQLSSAAENSEVLIELEVKGKIVKTERIKLNNEVKYFSFPIEEEHRGNVFVHYYFGKFNNALTGTMTVSVPHPDKSLKITAATLRDKLQPGAEEVWELTISGEDKDKFLVEMLTTMYDSSLDVFRSNNINFPMLTYFNYSKIGRWSFYQNFVRQKFGYINRNPNYFFSRYSLSFDTFEFFGFRWDGRAMRYNKMAAGIPDSAPVNKGKETMGAETEVEEDIFGYVSDATGSIVDISDVLIIVDGVVVSRDSINLDDYDDVKILEGEEATALYGERGANGVIIITTDKTKDQLAEVQARKNLQETAFFYPHLRTDEEGNIKIRFTVPESLTQWKFMAMAHTPEMRTGYYQTTVRTQKDLMVVPNPPRFLREGDQITFSSKVVNLSEEMLNGKAQLMLFDAFTMQPVDEEFGNLSPIRDINIAKGNSDNVSWNLKVPKNKQAVVYRIVATAGDFSDGEESALPILTNRMMVTETLPIHVREGQQKTFTLDKLQNNTSTTLDNFKLTFEMTANPIWYAIFSLPYLREYPYECSEQVFARLYGNLISEHIINSNPKIKAVFDDWNSKGELKSKLEQNEELKSILLEETPWVREAEREEDQMKKIAVLFDLNQMKNEQAMTFDKLKTKQSPSGGFPWFEGGNDNIYITTHIVSSFGQLKAMNIEYQNRFGGDLEKMLEGAIKFIDHKMEEEYDKYLKDKDKKPSIYNGIHYLYARSMFREEYPLSNKGNQIKNYYLKEFEKDMYDYSLQTKAMVALIFNRFGKEKQALSLLNSIKERAVDSDEMGMYWKSNTAGWFWYQAPIETQAMIIIAFDEITDDIESVESMRVWLLKNRQTNGWRSTKATTEAVFALMNTGKDWTNAEEGLTIKIADKPFNIEELENSPQSGTGYIKTSWSGEEIKPEMGKVEVDKTSPGVAWGAMYWQYFEDLDKITSAETGIKFKKELFLKKNSDKGPVLTRITEDTLIKVGDLVSVRLEIQTDRDMEFVHIKDMRASGFEPVNVFSRYKWQGGIGYYESTRDAATNFFVDRLPKGTYVFEYEIRANNAGNFSNGITSMQNMYAPELSAHSEGIRVEIK